MFNPNGEISINQRIEKKKKERDQIEAELKALTIQKENERYIEAVRPLINALKEHIDCCQSFYDLIKKYNLGAEDIRTIVNGISVSDFDLVLTRYFEEVYSKNESTILEHQFKRKSKADKRKAKNLAKNDEGERRLEHPSEHYLEKRSENNAEQTSEHIMEQSCETYKKQTMEPTKKPYWEYFGEPSIKNGFEQMEGQSLYRRIY